MREHKYRAWDKHGNCYVPITSIEWYFQDSTYKIRWINLLSGESVTPEHVILEEYANKKDKHDQEIYEGDIMQSKFGKRHVITYDGVSFRCGSGGYVYHKLWNRLEKIGDIHQNPELIP